MVTSPDGDILARKSWCSWGKGGIDGGSITTKTAMNRDAKKRNQEKQRNWRHYQALKVSKPVPCEQWFLQLNQQPKNKLKNSFLIQFVLLSYHPRMYWLNLILPLVNLYLTVYKLLIFVLELEVRNSVWKVINWSDLKKHWKITDYVLILHYYGNVFFSRLIFVSEVLKNSQSLSACVILDNQYLLKDFSDLKGDEPDAHAT